jgi:hypothetical protein
VSIALPAPFFPTPILDYLRANPAGQGSLYLANAAGNLRSNIDMYLAASNRNTNQIRVVIEEGLIASVAAACAVSCIPLESNFASFFGGSSLYRMLQPAIDLVINAPVRDYLQGLFRYRHLSMRTVINALSTITLSADTLALAGIHEGLSDFDLDLAAQIASAKAFDKETKDDYAYIKQLEKATLDYEINAQKEAIDEQINDRKTRIEELRKALKLPYIYV